MKKKIPKFKTEVEERKFWQQNDSSEYIDWAHQQVLDDAGDFDALICDQAEEFLAFCFVDGVSRVTQLLGNPDHRG